MDEIKELKEKLRSSRPSAWGQLPDIELYKDQVLSYMQRQILPAGEEDLLTGAMINNYIKAGALPRPNGKKYGREHLAYLTAICALKPVLSVSDMEYLLNKKSESLSAQDFYELLRSGIDDSMNEASDNLDINLDKEELHKYILSVALKATGLRIVCENLLKLMREEDEKEKSKAEKEKKAQNDVKKDKKEKDADK